MCNVGLSCANCQLSATKTVHGLIVFLFYRFLDMFMPCGSLQPHHHRHDSDNQLDGDSPIQYRHPRKNAIAAALPIRSVMVMGIVFGVLVEWP